METGFAILNNIVAYIVNPVIRVLFGAAFVLFLWGLLQFMWNLENVGDKEGKGNKRKEGMEHLKWGLVGMFIMIAVGGIINLVISTVDEIEGGGSGSSVQRSGNPLFGN